MSGSGKGPKVLVILIYIGVMSFEDISVLSLHSPLS